MKTLLNTLCLTIVVLLGSKEECSELGFEKGTKKIWDVCDEVNWLKALVIVPSYVIKRNA